MSHEFQRWLDLQKIDLAINFLKAICRITILDTYFSRLSYLDKLLMEGSKWAKFLALP